MGSTSHFSSGRGLQRRVCCFSLEGWALFNSILSSLLAILYFCVALTAPTAFFEAALCFLSVAYLLISLVVPFSIYRRDHELLEPFIIVLVGHAMVFLVLLAAAIYPCIEKGAKVLHVVDEVLKTKELKPIVACLFGADFVDTLTDSTRKTIVLVYIGLIAVVFLLALNAIVQTTRLMMEYDSSEAREVDDAWKLENGSYSTTIARSDGTRVLVNVDVKVERSCNTIKTSK